MTQLCKIPIREYREKYGLTAMLETGTGGGDGIRTAINCGYKKIVSCECDARIFNSQLGQFGPIVSLFQGFSEEVLPQMLWLIDNHEACLFWLDAHYPPLKDMYKGKATPLRKELEIISSKRDISRDVFLIDDVVLLEQGRNNVAWPEPVFKHGLPDIKFHEVLKFFPDHDWSVIERWEKVLVFTPK